MLIAESFLKPESICKCGNKNIRSRKSTFIQCIPNRVKQICILQYITQMIKVCLYWLTYRESGGEPLEHGLKNFLCFMYLPATTSILYLVHNTVETFRWKQYRYFSITLTILTPESKQLMLSSIFNFINPNNVCIFIYFWDLSIEQIIQRCTSTLTAWWLQVIILHCIFSFMRY